MPGLQVNLFEDDSRSSVSLSLSRPLINWYDADRLPSLTEHAQNKHKKELVDCFPTFKA